MIEERTPARSEVPEEYRWDLTRIYDSDEDWAKDMDKVRSRIPEISAFNGRLAGDASNIASCLRTIDGIEQDMERIYLYSHLKHDEDLNVRKYQDMLERARSLSAGLSEASSFVVPDILSSPPGFLDGIMDDTRLEFARVPLREVLRMREHYLDEASEMLLAMGQKPLGAVSRTFRMLNDADLSFGTVLDGSGSERPLTHARYSMYLLDPDRTLRKNAFEGLLGAYKALRNTMASLISGEMEGRRFLARARRYSSALEYALDPDEVTSEVYMNVIGAVSEFLPELHRYMRVRKEMMGLDELHMYDLYVPLVSDVVKEVPYEDAVELVMDSLSPAGDRLIAPARELFSGNTIDLIESVGKRSGAYSSSCYDRPPYILMNYTGKVKDLFTLSHEMGHSLHSLIANRSQPHIQADYPILLAEVASNFNEALLSHHLLQTWTSGAERAYLLNHELEEARTSVFRQCMFAEFEQRVSALAEKEEPLTPDLLCDIYGDLNRKYYGPDVVIDDAIRMEWSRIPHFYYDFYVYKYVTGFCCARSIAERVLSGDDEAKEGYLSMLGSGGSLPPLDALRLAGVDLSRPDPIREALSGFGPTIEEMERLMSGK